MKWKDPRPPYQSILEDWKTKSPREILGVSADAAPEEIKKQYRRLVRIYHPDRSDPFLTAVKEEILKKMSELDNITSMLQDFRRGRPTEIDFINGAIAAAGKKHGIPTPANEFVVALIKALEALRLRDA